MHGNSYFRFRSNEFSKEKNFRAKLVNTKLLQCQLSSFFNEEKKSLDLLALTKIPLNKRSRNFTKKTSPKTLDMFVSKTRKRIFERIEFDVFQLDLKPFIDERNSTALNEIDKWQNAVLGNQPGMFRSDEDDPEVKSETTDFISFSINRRFCRSS